MLCNSEQTYFESLFQHASDIFVGHVKANYLLLTATQLTGGVCMSYKNTENVKFQKNNGLIS